ncbi:predicted protein [Nematostella vectensis]|uniref:Uncharacterized protein n=1 Tax=Nematostella vectensis TaxID=45351 RepID=A7SIM5_NEMVE|nr:predicted protein [Nematostella vectensis]|eukprot:XP_001628496.1 predicted protein [Nematostella vectensis]
MKGKAVTVFLTAGTVVLLFLATGFLHNPELQNSFSISEKLACKQSPGLRVFGIDLLLVIVYSVPVYDSLPTLKALYQDVFPNILVCGPEPSNIYKIQITDIGIRGFFSYECMGRAIRENPGYNGYLYINDDMIVNWWNLVRLDKTLIWQGQEIVKGLEILPREEDRAEQLKQPELDEWQWWKTEMGISACADAYNEIAEITRSKKSKLMSKAIRIFLENGYGKPFCYRGWSDLFYIPKRFAKMFSTLCSYFYKNRVFLEMAVTSMIRMLDLSKNTVNLNGLYLYGVPDFLKKGTFWKYYNTNITFVHPFKLHYSNSRVYNYYMLQTLVLRKRDEMLDSIWPGLCKSGSQSDSDSVVSGQLDSTENT